MTKLLIQPDRICMGSSTSNTVTCLNLWW